jgi:hypothetical protein
MIYMRFLKSLILHKWYVFRAGIRLGGIPIWRLIIHDWSKFGPWEFGRYARNFFGDYGKSAVDRDEIDEDFAVAWLHHENLNPHHVGYWIPRTAQFEGKPLRMPDTYVREMVADMMGASKAYTGSWDMQNWINENLHRLNRKMHYKSVDYLWDVLAEELGYEYNPE